MGRIERLKTVTMARIEAFLASLETPETIVPQLAKEMADRVAEAARAEAKALTAVRADRRRLDGASGRVSRLQEGAMLAVKADKLDTARQAIAAQIEAEREVQACSEKLVISETAYESANAVRKQLQGQLEELKLRKEDLLARVRLVRQRRQLEGTIERLAGSRTRNLLDLVAQMEMDVEAQEAELEIQDQIRQTLGATFEHERAIELENDAEVSRRLQELRNNLENET